MNEPHCPVSILCDLCDKTFYPIDNPNSQSTVEHTGSDVLSDKSTFINQLDGNITLSTDITESVDDDVTFDVKVPTIPVLIGNRTHHSPHLQPHFRVLKTLRRSNKALQGSSLPIVVVYNMRSLLPKLFSWAEDFEERSVGLGVLTEVWEKSTNQEHQDKLEELFEMKGILYISTPRPGRKRGGGVALAADPSKFSLSKLNVQNPHNLEVVWGLLKPKIVTGSFSKIICCSFYSPPNSKKKTKLIDHLSLTLQDLLLEHPGAGVIFAGDRNDLSVGRLLGIDPSLRQVVKDPTHGSKILDVILTNISSFYNDPVLVDPIPVDNPDNGVPSDHLGVLLEPITCSSVPPLRQKRTISFRPKPDSKIREFGSAISEMSWDFLSPSLTSSQLTEAFQSKISEIIDQYFPEKNITLSENDQPWITNDLKKLKRLRQREYCRHGKSKKYFDLKKKFVDKQLEAVKHYTDKITNEVLEGHRTSPYKALRKLGVRTGDCKNELFQLPDHVADKLSEEESAERIANFFSAISQEFDPLDIRKLPPNIQQCLHSAKHDPQIPVLETHEVFRKIMKAKKPNSVIHGDIPKKVVQLFAPELAGPATIIFNKITTSFEYPRQWVKESQVVIPKVIPPNSETT